MQNDDEVHETDARSTAVAPAARGNVTVVQAEPFHCCTCGTVEALPCAVTTVTQKTDEAQETAPSATGLPAMAGGFVATHGEATT